MLSLATLTAKRAVLHSQLEQHVGQINRLNGAIAVVDELIGEAEQKQPCGTIQEAILRARFEAAEAEEGA